MRCDGHPHPHRGQPLLKGRRVVCLGIRDNYSFMQSDLMDLPQTKVGRHLQSI
jgi:predicted protein tyrosine phosphatase